MPIPDTGCKPHGQGKNTCNWPKFKSLPFAGEANSDYPVRQMEGRVPGAPPGGRRVGGRAVVVSFLAFVALLATPAAVADTPGWSNVPSDMTLEATSPGESKGTTIRVVFPISHYAADENEAAMQEA